VRNRFSARNHESQSLEPRIGAGTEPRVSIRGSGFHHIIFGPLRKNEPTVETALRYHCLSLLCPLDRLDGTPSEFTDAIDRLPKVRSQCSRPWALRWNAVGGLGRVNAFGFSSCAKENGVDLREIVEGTHFPEDIHAIHVICHCFFDNLG
jgi:hypothetical protein